MRADVKSVCIFAMKKAVSVLRLRDRLLHARKRYSRFHDFLDFASRSRKAMFTFDAFDVGYEEAGARYA